MILVSSPFAKSVRSRCEERDKLFSHLLHLCLCCWPTSVSRISARELCFHVRSAFAFHPYNYVQVLGQACSAAYNEAKSAEGGLESWAIANQFSLNAPASTRKDKQGVMVTTQGKYPTIKQAKFYDKNLKKLPRLIHSCVICHALKVQCGDCAFWAALPNE